MGSPSPALRAAVIRRDGPYCRWCARDLRDLPDQVTVDHLRPQSRGGGNTFDNLVVACFQCNHVKGMALHTEIGWLLLPPGGCPWPTAEQAHSIRRVKTTSGKMAQRAADAALYNGTRKPTSITQQRAIERARLRQAPFTDLSERMARARAEAHVKEIVDRVNARLGMGRCA